MRDARGVNLVENFFQDFALRAAMLRRTQDLRRPPCWRLLWAWNNVGIFSGDEGAALRLLPIPRAEQVVSIDQILHEEFKRKRAQRVQHVFLLGMI